MVANFLQEAISKRIVDFAYIDSTLFTEPFFFTFWLFIAGVLLLIVPIILAVRISVMANGQTIQLYGAQAMINLVDVGDFWGVVTYRHSANDFSWGYIEKIDYPVKYGAIWAQPDAALTCAAIGVAASQ